LPATGAGRSGGSMAGSAPAKVSKAIKDNVQRVDTLMSGFLFRSVGRS
jgi:hypothetical protein